VSAQGIHADVHPTGAVPGPGGAASLFFARQRRAPPAQRDDTLSSGQVRWLGSLLLATQLPMLAFVPLWIAGLGLSLVGLRFMLLARAARRPGAPPEVIRSWVLGVLALVTAIAIREAMGYFVGRDPCVAFLFTLIGIKYLETRRARDGTLIVCLACLLIITPFFYSQSLLAAAAAIPAIVLLGGALQALSRPAAMPPLAGGWRSPLALTFKMFAQGIPIAAMLFVLFPRVAGPLWGVPADHSANSGLSDRMAPGLISELSLSDAVAFRVDFDGPVPPPWLRYWRGPVLSEFDGREWTLSAQRSQGAFARGAGQTVIYTVTLEPHWKHWLFALDLPGSLPQSTANADAMRTDVDAVLTRDQQLFARLPVTQPLRYQQSSTLRETYPAGRGAELQLDIADNLRLPSEGGQSNPKTLAFARTLRRAHRDDAAFIDAVLDWFHREQFFYTLSPPLLGANSVDGFLFETRRGFCEHYASAFAVLLRAAGIPARVVTGYQGGTMNPSGDYMIVRQSDAHAWAEALVGGQWRRFDPTAAVAPSRIQMGLGGSLPASEPIPMLARLDETFLKSLQLSWDAINHGWRRSVIGFNFDRQRSLWRELKLDVLAPWQITTIVATIATIWVGALLGWLAWRRRRQDRARALWDTMCARLARAGLPRAAHEGPLAYAARAAARWPQFTKAFRVIGDSYAELRYGPVAARTDTNLERASALWRLRRALRMLPAAATLRKSVGASA
jgi:protein-glutamine gamma-glutamyltransferase